MSTADSSAPLARRLVGHRTLAVGGLLALTWSYASVLGHAAGVVGGARQFALVVAASFGLALLVGRYVDVRVAVVFASVLLGLGFAAYLLALPESQLRLLTPQRALSDTLALLTGLSVLRLVGAGVWATAVVPGPVFLSWYLAVRRRYVAATVAGGGALALVVLTGDADGVTTLVGVLGATATVAAATVDRHRIEFDGLDTLVVVLAAMIVASATLSVVPGAASAPILPDRGSPTVEANLIDAQDRVEIVGEIRLSPSVRFTVESDRRAYWKTATYDRYTSSGWVRTGSTAPYRGQLSGPPGPSTTLEQTVTARDAISILPAAWRPTALRGAIAEAAVVTPQGSLRPRRTLEAGETYAVRSQVPDADAERLRRAGTDYPDRVTDAYLQLPESTTQRVRDRAANVTRDAETPYEKAVAIERYLEANKEYSLDVPAPSGDVADTFLFERESGYCTYYATAMVVMLRSEGVPARFVTGYTPGESVGDDERVVRGLNSHAWVEVYFPEVGWIRFDPTPAEPRLAAENTRVTEARQSGEPSVDINGSNGTVGPPSGATAGTPELPAGATAGNRTPSAEAVNVTPGSGPGGAAETAVDDSVPISLPRLPSRRTLLIGAAALVGVAAGARRTRRGERAIRLLSAQHQRRRDPASDVETAYRRIATALDGEYRSRRPGETPRSYLQSVPDAYPHRTDVARVGQLYEQARYGSGVDREEATEAVAIADRVVRSATPLVRRLR
jgi:transglutaminase-like putative cysteine protease